MRSFARSKHWNTILGKISANSNSELCKVNAKLCKICAKFNAQLCSIDAQA